MYGFPARTGRPESGVYGGSLNIWRATIACFTSGFSPSTRRIDVCHLRLINDNVFTSKYRLFIYIDVTFMLCFRLHFQHVDFR